MRRPRPPGPLIRAALRAMGLTLAAKIAAFGLAMALAQRFGPEGYGLFTFALGAGLLGARVATLGWPTLMTRLIPAFRAVPDPARLAGLLRMGDRVVLAGVLVLTLCLATAGWVLGAEHPLAPGLILAAALLPGMAFRSLARAQLAAAGHPGRAVTTDELIAPALALALLPLAAGPGGATLGYAGAAVLAAGLGLGWRRAALPPARHGPPPKTETRAWMAIALPALLGMSAKLLMARSDVLMLAPLASLEAVGLYGAAARLTALQTTPVVAFCTVLSPALAAARADGDEARLRRLIRSGLGLALVLSAPGAALFVFAPEPVLGLIFGEAFRPAAPVLALLALAQMAAAAGMITTAALLMTGRERLFGGVTLAALALNLALNLMLIPPLGALGAALATLAAQTGLLMAQGVCLHRFLQRPDHVPHPA